MFIVFVCQDFVPSIHLCVIQKLAKYIIISLLIWHYHHECTGINRELTDKDFFKKVINDMLELVSHKKLEIIFGILTFSCKMSEFGGQLMPFDVNSISHSLALISNMARKSCLFVSFLLL